MSLLDRLERTRFGKFGIPNLMRYVIGVNIVGILISLVNPMFYYSYLSLDIASILHGQVWRIFTFVLSPSGQFGGTGMVSLLWFAIWIFVYYSIGTNLERMWGTFRFNLFYFGGLLLVVIMTFVFYLFLQLGWMPDVVTAYNDYKFSANIMDDLNQTMFLAFAFAFPDAQFLVYFIIPVKAKWLSIVYLLMDGYMFVRYLMSGYYYSAAVILVLLLNFFIFYFMGRGSLTPKQAYHQKKRKMEYKKKTAPTQGSVPRHHCVICGRTDVDSPQLEFRYCSKCEGNYEYCSEHLFTHEHVHH